VDTGSEDGMTQPSLDWTINDPSAVEARRSGHAEGRRRGPTLRARYLALLEATPLGLTDHQAGMVLDALSTTIGARRMEIMDAEPGRIVSKGRVVAGRTSRTIWGLA
jgi:hypothetical protein